MRRSFTGVALAAVVLAAAGCGARVAAENAGGTAQVAGELGLAVAGEVATASPSEATSPSPATDPGAQTAPAHAASDPARPPDAPTSDAPRSDEPTPAGSPASPDELPVEVRVDPVCVAVGSTISAEVVTVPDSELTMAVAYSDGRPHGQMGFARADADGVHRWSWAVSPDVPPGDARLVVMAVTPDGERADHDAAEFRVVDMEGGCS